MVGRKSTYAITLSGFLFAHSLSAAPEDACPVEPPDVSAPPSGLIARADSGEALYTRALELRDKLLDEIQQSSGRSTEPIRADLIALLDEIQAAPSSARAIDALLYSAKTLEGLPSSLRRTAAAYASASESARSIGDSRRQSLANGGLASLYFEAARRDDARTLFRRALFQATSSDAPELTFRWQWKLAQVEAADGNVDASLTGLRQAVSTLKQLDLEALTSAPQDADAAEASPALVFRQLVDQLLQHAARAPDDAARQRLLAEAQSVLESFKVRELRDYFRDSCLDLQPRVAPDMIPGTVVLYPISLPNRLEMIVRKQGRLSRYVVDVGEEELRTTIDRLRRGLERRSSFGFRADAERLYDWIVRPVESELAELTADDVLVFIPDGALRTIPMAALRDRESGKYLIERFPIAITPGLTLTEPRAIDWPKAEILAVGASKPQEGFPALPNVPKEIEAVREAFPEGAQLLDQSFSPDALEEQLSERAFEIVHIASHGEFSADASTSFILTHAGRLEMDKLASIVGVTRFRERSLELLTLSACQTAAGDDRAALGLAGVAVQAGARSALASLWSVDDRGASLLVSNFYSGLRQKGDSRAKAWQRAQLQMLRETPYRHPAFWSAFVLINNWL